MIVIHVRKYIAPVITSWAVLAVATVSISRWLTGNIKPIALAPMQIQGSLAKSEVASEQDLVAESEIGEQKNLVQGTLNELLYIALQLKDFSAVERYLEAGADANFATSDGTPILTFATIRGNVEISRLLIKHGADVNAASKLGNTPLHYAANHDALGAAQVLIELGAELDIKNNDGQTALDLAVSEEMIRLLSEAFEGK